VLVLLSFGLVLVATVLLVLGLLSDDGLMLIYLSIASSVAAAVVLVIALKLNKPSDELRSTGPEPLPIPEPEPAMAGASARSTAPAPAAAESGDEWLASDLDTWSADDEWQEGDEVEFPIADYDTLTSSQILPLLPQLYADEIPVIEARERATKARPEILEKLDDLRDTATVIEPLADDDREPDEEPASEPAGVDPLASYTEPASDTGSWDDDDWFPIEDYESLSAAQIRPLLPELDAEELAMVRDKESELGRRRSLLDEIDRLLPAAAGAPPPARSAASARPTSSATAPVAPSRPAATRASRPTTTKRSAASTSRTAAGTKKAPTRKATAAKKGTAAKKAAAPAKKGTAAKKATAAKKGTAAKKATAANKGAAKKAPAAKKAGPTKR
jgi:hypothetical protein